MKAKGKLVDATKLNQRVPEMVKPARIGFPPLFIQFAGDKKRRPTTAEEINGLMKSATEKRSYEVTNEPGNVVFSKTFKG
jgi:hypothetical protein